MTPEISTFSPANPALMASPTAAIGHISLRSLLPLLITLSVLHTVRSDQFPADGKVLELDDSTFDASIAAHDFVFVDFYAPWCGHCKKIAPELDRVAQMLASRNEKVVIAKLNADKYRKLAEKYEVDGFPTLKLFMHGIPMDYTGSRKADLLVRFLRKFVAPNVSLLESDVEIRSFVETAGTHFPIFIGFGLNESLFSESAAKYKKNAWFSVAKGFSEEAMIEYDFDKVPALVSLHPKFNEKNVFYGPFEGGFLEDFIRDSQLPLAVPINSETLGMLSNDERKIVVTFMEDELDDKGLKLVKILRSAATANRDLVFGYVGVKQWGEFAETFDISKSSKLPKMLVWDRNEEYHLVVGSETLNDDEDHGSQISRFLVGYREGRTVKTRVSGPSFMGYINSLIGIGTVYLIVFLVACFMVIRSFNKQDDDGPHPKEQTGQGVDDRSASSESHKEDYDVGVKED